MMEILQRREGIWERGMDERVEGTAEDEIS